MVRSTVQMFSVYAGFRLGNTATKYVAEYRRCDPVKAARILKLTLMISAVLCGIVSLILLLSSRFLAVRVLANETLAAAIAMGAFMLFFLRFTLTSRRALWLDLKILKPSPKPIYLED